MATHEKGSCLCGQYQYDITRESVVTTLHCHCRDCRKVTGSGKATIAMVPEDQFTSAGELKTYQCVGSEGSHVTRGFCPTCGSQLLSYVEEIPGLIFIKAGTLEDGSWLTPSMSVWRDTAEPWSPVDETLACADRNPDMAAFG